MPPRTGALAAYLRAVRNADLPVDRDRIAVFGLPCPTPSLSAEEEQAAATAFLETLHRALTRLPEEDRVLAQHHLFHPGDPATRGNAAVTALSATRHKVSQSHYRNHLASALVALASAIHEEITTSLPVDTPTPADTLTATWYDEIDIDWELALDPTDFRRQHWRFTHKFRCRFTAQPIVEIPLDWSGQGYREEDEPVVVTGQDRKDRSHKFLRIRPETDKPSSWDLYLFDLGTPLVAGAVDTLSFTMTLYDEGDKFQPIIYRRTHDKPALEKLTSTVRCPPPLVIRNAQAHRERFIPETGRYVPIPPAESLPVFPGGVVRQVVRQIEPSSRYVLRWDHQDPSLLATSRG